MIHVTSFKSALAHLDTKHRKRLLELVQGMRAHHHDVLSLIVQIASKLQSYLSLRSLVYYPQHSNARGAGFVLVFEPGKDVEVAQHLFPPELSASLDLVWNFVQDEAGCIKSFRQIAITSNRRQHDEIARAVYACLREFSGNSESTQSAWAQCLSFSDYSPLRVNPNPPPVEGLLLASSESALAPDLISELGRTIYEIFLELERHLESGMSMEVSSQGGTGVPYPDIPNSRPDEPVSTEAAVNAETNSKPKVFIGSSTEGLSIAEALQLGLSRTADCTVWNQGVFTLSKGALEALVTSLRKFDYAIVVFTPDDLLTKRDLQRNVPRDNVVFELGLFMGALGPDRTFIVHPRDQDLNLPSDLAGVTSATYDSSSDLAPLARLGPVCTLLRQAMGIA